MRSLAGVYIGRVIDIIFAVIEFFIGLRIILQFFSANPGSVFVSWIYQISGAILSPFIGMFPNINFRFGMLDVNAIIGLILYAILFSLILWVVRTLTYIPGQNIIEERQQIVS